MLSRPTLTLLEIDAFDPNGPPNRKCCPLCGQHKPKDAVHRSLSLDRASGVWNCFRCGHGGKVKEAWKTGTPAPLTVKAVRQQKLQSAFGLPGAVPPGAIGEQNPQTEQGRGGEDPPKFDWRSAWEVAPPLEGTGGEQYLSRRCIPCSVASLAGARFCVNWHGHPSLLFPIRDRGKELVAVQGRAVRGHAKITHGPKKEGAFFAPVLFNGEQSFDPLDAKAPAIILTEAPIDALSVATCGFPALALCGTSGPSWLHLACGLRRVLLAFDADDPGDRAARHIEHLLHPYGVNCERLQPQGFKDWNEWLCSDTRAMEGFLVTSVL